ncbi:MAG: hypothetical protein HYR96_04705 [Deltaproteobacteria bacterium]|nr:hypothetical protein [Deltaproteobacteria bacterium]MBI3295243.1 hypothetical protein [Deltaproteobacteria bacterium]
MKAIVLVNASLMLLVSPLFAAELPSYHSEQARRKEAPQIQVCTIGRINTSLVAKLLKESPVICYADGYNRVTQANGRESWSGGSGTPIKLTQKILNKVKGRYFLMGDPCHASPQDQGQPADLKTLWKGYAELIREACEGEVTGYDDVDVTLSKDALKIIEQLDNGNVFTPHGCQARPLHK